MSSAKIVLYVISVVILLLTGSVYFSDKNTSSRKLAAMLENDAADPDIILAYLSHHQHDVDSHYDNALQLIALQSSKHLNEVINYYTHGSFILNVSTADKILEQLPSDSTAINHAAGRIYATQEFGRYDPAKATQHLGYAALRGNKDAAETLSIIYTQSDCLVEAITWAKVANSRDTTSECTKLPVDMQRLNDNEWDAVVHNEQALEIAAKNNTVPLLKYSSRCTLIPQPKQ